DGFPGTIWTLLVIANPIRSKGGRSRFLHSAPRWTRCAPAGAKAGSTPPDGFRLTGADAVPKLSCLGKAQVLLVQGFVRFRKVLILSNALDRTDFDTLR